MSEKMATPTEVFVVTAGNCSDYHIVSIFSEKTDAQRLADKLNGFVETYLLNPPIVYPTMPYYTVIITRESGGILSCYQVANMNDADGSLHPQLTFQLKTWIKRIEIQKPTTTQQLHVSCYAADASHAIKIAADVYARVMAENYWRFARYDFTNFVSDSDIEELLAEEARLLLNVFNNTPA